VWEETDFLASDREQGRERASTKDEGKRGAVRYSVAEVRASGKKEGTSGSSNRLAMRGETTRCRVQAGREGHQAATLRMKVCQREVEAAAGQKRETGPGGSHTLYIFSKKGREIAGKKANRASSGPADSRPAQCGRREQS